MWTGERAILGAVNAAAPVPVWCSETETLVCRAVRDETPDVKTFVFTAREPRLFVYAPGQFVTLKLPIEGETASRCYTISTTPTRPYAIAITVKRVPGGIVSNHLHDRLRIGDEVRAHGALGDFTIGNSASHKLLFVSAGIGITPMLSIARALADLESIRDVVFLHCARSARDRVVAAELKMLAKRLPCFRLLTFLSKEEGLPEIGLRYGRLAAQDLLAEVPDLGERDVLCCGPQSFMALVRTALAGGGYPMARYQEESFHFGEQQGGRGLPSEPIANKQPVPFRVTFYKRGQTISCGADTTILQAARMGGIALPSSCVMGMCGTCKTRKLSGSVTMQHNGGIRPREIEQGFVLLCCSKPTADVVLDR